MVLTQMSTPPHFITPPPVTSTLSNISEAVLWLQKHDDQALTIANAAAKLGQEVLTVGALSLYMEELVLGYARLYRDSGAVSALLSRLPQDEIVRFECHDDRTAQARGGGFECGFMHSSARTPVESVMAAAGWTGAVGAC